MGMLKEKKATGIGSQYYFLLAPSVVTIALSLGQGLTTPSTQNLP